MNTVKVQVLPYVAPKQSQRTWNSKGYVASVGRKKVTVKENYDKLGLPH